MAQRRLFSLKIVNSDAFLDMPLSTQALYFHLSMQADDDGFVSPKKTMRMLGTTDDDLKILLAKRFVLSFETGVIVIKHWLIHNTILKDRYIPTLYEEEKKLLKIKENKAYTECLQNDNKMLTEVKLSKVKLSYAADAAKNFNSGEYIKKMLEDKNTHVRIIGRYFEYTAQEFPSAKAISKEIGRWSKTAIVLADYPIERFEAAMEYCQKNFNPWSLEAVLKNINRV